MERESGHSHTLERALSVLMAVFVMAAGSAVVWSQLFSSPGASSGLGLDTPRYYLGWEREVTGGLRDGPEDALLTIVEFTDFQCPFCRRHADVIDAVRAEFPDEIQVIVLHFPLPQHRFAAITAVAAECADHQGSFPSAYRTLFANQDSIGLKPWYVIGEEAGISDVHAFETCVMETPTTPRIEHGRALGERMGVTATPTVLVNGWRMPRPPQPDELRAALDVVLAGGAVARGDTVVLAGPRP